MAQLGLGQTAPPERVYLSEKSRKQSQILGRGFTCCPWKRRREKDGLRRKDKGKEILWLGEKTSWFCVYWQKETNIRLRDPEFEQVWILTEWGKMEFKVPRETLKKSDNKYKHLWISAYVHVCQCHKRSQHIHALKNNQGGLECCEHACRPACLATRA